VTEGISGKVAALAQVPLFGDLSEKQIRYLAERASARDYEPKELIFSEGDPCQGLFIIAAGRVRIFKSSASGREQVLGFETAGHSLAELPVFDGGPYPASAEAVTASRLLFIRKQDFHALCQEEPEVALKVLRVVGRRLRHLVGIVEELSFTTVRQRLAGLLLRFAEQYGKATPRGVEFTIEMSNQELAAYLGTVRELVSRNLSRLQAGGIIQLEGKKVLVPDVKALEAEAQSEN